MAKLTGKELEELFAREYRTHVATDMRIVGTREDGKPMKEYDRKLYRIVPANWHPDVVAWAIGEAIGRMHGRYLNNVAPEKGMKSAAFDRMVEQLDAGIFPEEMTAKRVTTGGLSPEESMIVQLAKQDLIAILRPKIKGSGNNGRVLIGDILGALQAASTTSDMVRSAGDGLAWDDTSVLDWATDESRKRDYVADAKAELQRMAELEAAADDANVDDLLADI